VPKRKNINGLPHNLTKSYFGTLRYYGNGYMADWLLNAAINLRVNSVTLDIINSTIDPEEMEKLPLMYHLKELKTIIEKELSQNGFDNDFIVSAKIKVEIPDNNIYSRSLYCYPELIDKDGRRYASGRIIERAYERKFDPFEHRSLAKSLLAKIKRIFK
jgi:hypothetical protein